MVRNFAMFKSIVRRGFATAIGATFISTGIYLYLKNENQEVISLLKESKAYADNILKNVDNNWIPPSRQEILKRLQGFAHDGSKLSEQDAEFDVLIIGGGATGAGCALDAATRGLKTAMVEKDDFSSGIFLVYCRNVF
jgi:glycerol-3-phosphate dehydrogenase